MGVFVGLLQRSWDLATSAIRKATIGIVTYSPSEGTYNCTYSAPCSSKHDVVQERFSFC